MELTRSGLSAMGAVTPILKCTCVGIFNPSRRKFRNIWEELGEKVQENTTGGWKITFCTPFRPPRMGVYVPSLGEERLREEKAEFTIF
ncbi:hypothetical protein CEXT_79001 [Caerostris extrusa]|uniref:Uncharacterized protein n=1 Tax=Caerostris extrusa TaxID=172846 RepID=A0AAV4PS47_CAEEX|nr:hypothetical protein CEXT_79001 [Caerostris extrusa]